MIEFKGDVSHPLFFSHQRLDALAGHGGRRRQLERGADLFPQRGNLARRVAEGVLRWVDLDAERLEGLVHARLVLFGRHGEL